MLSGFPPVSENCIDLSEGLVDFLNCLGEYLPSDSTNFHFFQFEELICRRAELLDGLQSLSKTVETRINKFLLNKKKYNFE